MLELDVLRRTLTPTPTYEDAERHAVYRALVVIARALTRAGCAVLIDATAHRREWRDFARASIEHFAEIQLICPLEVARAREASRGSGHHPRAIYARAGQPGATVPGVDVVYEPALAPELTIDTTTETVESAAARVAALAQRLKRRPLRSPLAEAWVLWVSGRPGSGKTTVVCDVVERVTRQGIMAAVLDPGEFMALIADGHRPSALHATIATRALVLAAKLLSDAGVATIIDGTVPRHEATALAREMIDEFGLVELMCPPDICRTRERAVRWGIVPYPTTPGPMVMPSLGLDYEPAVAPDLVVYTDMVDRWTTIEEVMRLVQRLAGAARQRRHPSVSNHA
jgi:adenylylsulfate kinase